MVPYDRFRFAGLEPVEVDESTNVSTRKVSRMGQISFAGHNYGVGAWLAGETVKVTTTEGLITVEHEGVEVVSHRSDGHP